MNFIKKISDKNFDESVHQQLIRYGKGEYRGRAPISVAKTSKLKLKSGFEFVNDFVLFASNFDVKFDGFIWGKDEIGGLENEGIKGAKKTGKWVYEVKDLEASKVKKIFDEAYYLLLNCKSDEITLKSKKKLPKPGKDEHKIDDKFCQMELDAKYFDVAKKDFFWDLPDFKKAKAAHNFLIEGIEIPSELKDSKDFALVRERSRRVGKVVRKITVDGSEKEEVFEFNA